MPKQLFLFHESLNHYALTQITLASHPAKMLLKISLIDKLCQRILFKYRNRT